MDASSGSRLPSSSNAPPPRALGFIGRAVGHPAAPLVALAAGAAAAAFGLSWRPRPEPPPVPIAAPAAPALAPGSAGRATAAPPPAAAGVHQQSGLVSFPAPHADIPHDGRGSADLLWARLDRDGRLAAPLRASRSELCRRFRIPPRDLLLLLDSPAAGPASLFSPAVLCRDRRAAVLRLRPSARCVVSPEEAWFPLGDSFAFAQDVAALVQRNTAAAAGEDVADAGADAGGAGGGGAAGDDAQRAALQQRMPPPPPPPQKPRAFELAVLDAALERECGLLESSARSLEERALAALPRLARSVSGETLEAARRLKGDVGAAAGAAEGLRRELLRFLDDDSDMRSLMLTARAEEEEEAAATTERGGEGRKDPPTAGGGAVARPEEAGAQFPGRVGGLPPAGGADGRWAGRGAVVLPREEGGDADVQEVEGARASSLETSLSPPCSRKELPSKKRDKPRDGSSSFHARTIAPLELPPVACACCCLVARFAFCVSWRLIKDLLETYFTIVDGVHSRLRLVDEACDATSSPSAFCDVVHAGDALCPSPACAPFATTVAREERASRALGRCLGPGPVVLE